MMTDVTMSMDIPITRESKGLVELISGGTLTVSEDGNIREVCRICGRPVLVNIFRGSELCSVNCQKADARRKELDAASTCYGVTTRKTRCSRKKPADVPAPWFCLDHTTRGS